MPPQPDGFSSARVLPNVPQHYSQLRSALSVLQQQLDMLLRGSSTDQVEGGLAAAGLCIVVQRCWAQEAAAVAATTAEQDTQLLQALDIAATNAGRAARFISRATEQAAQVLLAAANGTNTLPDVQWEAFPAALRQQLLELFQGHGWVSSLGFPVLKKQLPYERPMGLEQYHSFIVNNPHYVVEHWDESNYWAAEMTPTPAKYPWLHLREMQQALTEDRILSMSARLPAFQAVLQAAVDASILPEQLLRQAEEAAAQALPSTTELFVRHWVQQAGATVSVAARQLLSAVSTSTAPAAAGTQLLCGASDGPLRSRCACVEDRGDGSGGRCHSVLTAVGSGDEGGRPGGSLPVLPYGDAQEHGSDLVAGAEGLPDADPHWGALDLKCMPEY